jgi:hypothetical protein
LILDVADRYRLGNMPCVPADTGRRWRRTASRPNLDVAPEQRSCGGSAAEADFRTARQLVEFHISGAKEPVSYWRKAVGG